MNALSQNKRKKFAVGSSVFGLLVDNMGYGVA